MIPGEEYLINTAGLEEYDYFLKKARRKIRKSQPLKLLNPIRAAKSGIKLGGKVSKAAWNIGTAAPKAVIQSVGGKKKQKKKTRSVRPQVDPMQAQQEQERILQETLAREEQELAQELEQREAEKQQVQKAEQVALDAQNNNAKRMLTFGLIGVCALGIITGSILYFKSRQNQLAALNIKD